MSIYDEQQSTPVIYKYKYIYIFIYIHFLKIFFSIVAYYMILNRVPCPVHRTLLFIHPIRNCFYLLSWNFQTISVPVPSPLTTRNVLSVCESLSVSEKFTWVTFYLPHIIDIIWYLSFSVWLASLSMITFMVHRCCCKWYLIHSFFMAE